jgi:hypothetical protein
MTDAVLRTDEVLTTDVGRTNAGRTDVDRRTTDAAAQMRND